MKELTREEAQKEVDNNFEIFEKEINNIIEKYPGKKFILLKNKEIIGGFDSEEDAETTAKLLFKDSPLFSIQEVNPIPLDLGYQGYEMFSEPNN